MSNGMFSGLKCVTCYGMSQWIVRMLKRVSTMQLHIVTGFLSSFGPLTYRYSIIEIIYCPNL
jgi:hypothetical protein